VATDEQRVRNALESPAQWNFLYRSGDDEDQYHVGILDWFFCCHFNAVSGTEQSVIRDAAAFDFELDSMNTSELPAIAKNLEEARPRALSMFGARIGRVYKLPFLRPSHDGKHFIPNQEKDKVLKRSRGGPSLFFKDYHAEELRYSFWSWVIACFSIVYISDETFGDNPYDNYIELMESSSEHDNTRAALWKRICTAGQFRIAYDTRAPIGAVDGDLATHVCFDVGVSNIHAYLVSEAEAKAIMEPDNIFISKTLW
jgi:hypothetical protein